MNKNALSLLPFGAQYYRCPTPLSTDWERDIQGFAAQGFNTLKIWAIWRTNNPREGVYDFSDLARLMDLAQENGVKVIINAIMDAAPAWFFEKYPEAVMETCADGPIRPRAHACRQMGGCPGPCLHHREGQRIRREFMHKLAERFRGHPALLCWDLWNEPEHTVCIKREMRVEGLTCYCPQSVADFRAWLEKKYGAVEELNRVWGRNYESFRQAEVPVCADCFKDMVDWRLFMTDTITDELRLRAEAVRAEDSVHPVMVHTVTIPFFPQATCGSDDTALASLCDIFGNSVGSEPLSAAITTSAAPGKMVINAEIHAVGGSTYQRPVINDLHSMKRHIFQPLAQGIKGFVFWQYRPERLGLESPAWGLTDLEGNPTPWLEAAAEINRALQARADLILHSAPSPTGVGILNSQRAQLFDFCVSRADGWYIASVKGALSMLRAAGYNPEIVSDLQMTDEHLARYRVLYDPFPYYKDAASCAALRRWVENGGTLIAEGPFGAYSDDDGLHTVRQPGFGFDEVFGAQEERVTTASSFQNAYDKEWSSEHDQNLLDIRGELPARGFHFYEALHPTTGAAAASFADGRAACVVNRCGKGTAIALGSLLAIAYERNGAKENAAFVARLIQKYAEVFPLFETPDGVRIDALCAPEGQLLVVDNGTKSGEVVFRPHTQKLCGARLRNIMTGEVFPADKPFISVNVEPFGIEVFEVL